MTQANSWRAPFDAEAADHFAALAAGRRQAGRPISQAVVQIAAIARSRSGALATRNVPDFAAVTPQADPERSKSDDMTNAEPSRQEDGCCLWRLCTNDNKCARDSNAPIMRVAAS